MKKKSVGLGLLLLLFIMAGSVILYKVFRPKEIVLEFGMFAGSNWDVENPNSYVIIDQAIREFEQEHPGVKIHYYSGVSREDYSEWLSRKLLNGEMPDVFMVLDEDFHKFSSMGVMKNLESLIEKDQTFDRDAFYETALAAGQYQEKQYAFPYETVPMLMFVNKTLLEQEGLQMPDADWNWEDLYEICRRVTRDTDGDGMLDQFATYNYSWLEAAYSNGVKLFDMDGKTSNLSSAETQEAILFAEKITALNGGHKVTQEDFNSGKVAFMPLSFAKYRTYKNYPYKIRRYKDFQWDCTTFPSQKRGDNKSIVDSLLVGISSRTRQEELAWEFLKKLTYEEKTQMKILQYSQGASVLRKVMNSEEAEAILQEDIVKEGQIINLQVFNDILENGIVTPKFANYQQVLSLADSEISSMFDANKNIESSLKKLQRSIEDYLEN